MNRLVPLAIATTLSLGSAVTMAADLSVSDIRQQIQQRQSEFDNYNQNLESEINVSKTYETELEELRAAGVLAEADRVLALNEMNRQYEDMIENPDLDISQAQATYQRAVRERKLNKDAITNKYNQWQSKLQEVEQLRLSKHVLLNTIEGLKEQMNSARVDRIYDEFNRKDSINVSHNIVCDREETIAKCSDRGKTLAKQKASKRFLDELYESLTESSEASQRRTSSDGFVQVLRSEVTDSGFSGQGNFSVSMAVELQGNLKRNQACELLGLDNRYCQGGESTVEVAQVTDTPVQTDESVMYELTVRSNVYDDEVFIDGVSYGSTRLQVMLPSGEHDVEVVKRGYDSYREQVVLNESRTLKIDLERAQFTFSRGEKIQDILDGDVPGPSLVVVPAGSFKMGDITGVGLENERPVTSSQINDSYGIGEVEVTVVDYQRFVDATSYVTEAEKSKGCAYYENGSPVWQEQYNWKSPGYNQSDKHPVVCISMKDAQAYVDWLSSSSGHSYRLPAEFEWEYAARAGEESDYWWGDRVGTDNANCGWCGSQWSNVSSAPVSAFDRNSFGLFDTVGNVWEWSVSDSAQSGAVVRGGAWNFAPRLARVSTRMELEPNFRSNYIGFRVLRER
ncbi:PEGA domain-containing protein [Alteromonadaceae bacterium M269]|nr:PEGA domain-containing protein [Alteromonadaceae bacterium M269]